MDIIDIIHAHTSFKALLHSLSNSIKELKEKSPHREDFIIPMEKHFLWMNEAHETFNEMEQELRASNRQVMAYYREIMELKHENKLLKAQNQNLMEGL